MSLCGHAAAVPRRAHLVSSTAAIRRSFAFVVQGYHAVPGMEPPPVKQIGYAHLNEQHFWKWGLSIKQIAELTGKPEKDVPQELRRQIGAGVSISDLVHNLTSVPEDFICPVSEELFNDPVVGPDGMRYERSAILERIEVDGLSPISGETIDESQLTPAADTATEVANFRRQSVEKILEYTPVLLSCKQAKAAAAILNCAELFAVQDKDKIQIAEYKKQLDEAMKPCE